jgi:predicted metalloprotease with PDZ domain
MRHSRTVSLGIVLAGLSSALAAPASAQRATPGWIGIAYEVAMTGDRLGETHVWITDVSRGSPAEEAGIRVGDRVVSINGLSGHEELKDLPGRLRLQAGQQVAIRLDRDGRRVDLQLRAAERPGALAVNAPTFSFQADSMADVMFRAMDSLRVHLVEMNGAELAREIAAGVEQAGAFTVFAPGGRESVTVPFEFFVFRGERHDSLVREMEELNRQLGQLRRQESVRASELQRTSRNTRAVTQDRQLSELRSAIEEITRSSAELRTAMAAAARATAAAEYLLPAEPTAPAAPPEPRAETFRPLTPYLLGSNRVAGAQVIDIRPELGAYFGVQSGVLVVDVAPGTPASVAGLVPGDVVTRIDQVGVRTVEDFRFGVAQADDTLPVTLIRRGSTLQVLLRRR